MKKKIIIAIIIMLLIGAVLVVINNKTDLFKSSEQKFWKYFSKNSEITNVFNDENIQSIKNSKTNKSYITNSSFMFDSGSTKYTVTANTRAQNSNDLITYVDFKYNNNDIVNLNLVKKSNLVGIKMNELANGYIALKNNNVNELLDEIDIEDKSMYPDNINWTTYIDLLYLAPSDVKYITNTYTELVSKDLTKENYSKEESGIKIDDKIHAVTGYKITLSENETKKILSDIYTNMSEDSRTLNLVSSKLKLMNLPSKYTDINYLSDKFLNIAHEIDSAKSTDEEFMEIIVYTENNELLQTAFKIRNERIIKITYSKKNNKINIKQEVISENSKENTDFCILEDVCKFINNIEEANISNECSDNQTFIKTKFNVSLFSNQKIELISTTQIVDSVEKDSDFEDSIKIVLNELDSNKLKGLCSVLKTELSKIYNEKKATIDGYKSQAENVSEGEDVNTNE